jgi:hypothetical protein
MYMKNIAYLAKSAQINITNIGLNLYTKNNQVGNLYK